MSIGNPYENYFPMLWVDKWVKEAKISGLWINIGKTWLTPDEFPEFASKNRMFHADNYLNYLIDDIKLKDPRPIIKRMEKQIEKKLKEMTDKKNEFEKRVNDYYKK